MDAVRVKEWKMFAVLKDMADETAYRIFMLAHLPIYISVLFCIVYGNTLTSNITKIVIDVFLIGHAVLHHSFRHKKENGFSSWLSKAIIYTMPLLALLHLVMLIFI